MPAGRREPIAAPRSQQYAALRQREDQFFREKRIAVGSFRDMRHHLVEAGAVSDQIANHLANLAEAKLRQGQFKKRGGPEGGDQSGRKVSTIKTLVPSTAAIQVSRKSWLASSSQCRSSMMITEV